MASWRQLGKRQQSSQLQPYPRNAVIASWAAVPADDGDRPTLQSPLRYRSRSVAGGDSRRAKGSAGQNQGVPEGFSVDFSGPGECPGGPQGAPMSHLSLLDTRRDPRDPRDP